MEAKIKSYTTISLMLAIAGMLLEVYWVLRSGGITVKITGAAVALAMTIGFDASNLGVGYGTLKGRVIDMKPVAWAIFTLFFPLGAVLSYLVARLAFKLRLEA